MPKIPTVPEWQQRHDAFEIALEGAEMIRLALRSGDIPEYLYKGTREPLEKALVRFEAAMRGGKHYCGGRAAYYGGKQ
jgi:hypothetical protein